MKSMLFKGALFSICLFQSAECFAARAVSLPKDDPLISPIIKELELCGNDEAIPGTLSCKETEFGTPGMSDNYWCITCTVTCIDPTGVKYSDMKTMCRGPSN